MYAEADGPIAAITVIATPPGQGFKIAHEVRSGILSRKNTLLHASPQRLNDTM